MRRSAVHHHRPMRRRSVDQLLTEARARLPLRLLPAEAMQAARDGALLLDIRSDDQRRVDGLIPGALVIPRNSLEWRCDPTSPWRHPDIRDHECRLIIVCNEGFQSSLAAATLQQLGMRHATDLDGGFVAWKQAGMPVVAGGASATPGARRRECEAHWQAVYARSDATAVSWYQQRPTVSLALINALGIAPDCAVLDVGGGASTLTATLLGSGFRDLTVLDVSQLALAASRERLGPDATHVHWVHHDLLTWRPGRRYGLWHDRATLHFLLDPDDRAAYVTTVEAAVEIGGSAIVGVFAEDGPAQCSGLPVLRYSAGQIAALFGPAFDLVSQQLEDHVTPSGAVQRFQWAAQLGDGRNPEGRRPPSAVATGRSPHVGSSACRAGATFPLAHRLRSPRRNGCTGLDQPCRESLRLGQHVAPGRPLRCELGGVVDGEVAR